MALKEDAALVREAARDLHPNETFEKALGRIVRRHGGSFADYVRIASDLREFAAKRKLPLEEAAREYGP